MMKTTTIRIRMDAQNFEFLSARAKEEQTDVSKAVLDLVTRGRVLLAIEKYRDGEVSLGKAAELAGMRVGQMMKTLADFGVESRIEQDDYLQGLANLKNAW